MKNKNKIALYTALSAVAIGLLGTGVASARYVPDALAAP